jgi:hypothetical protein
MAWLFSLGRAGLDWLDEFLILLTGRAAAIGDFGQLQFADLEPPDLLHAGRAGFRHSWAVLNLGSLTALAN